MSQSTDATPDQPAGGTPAGPPAPPAAGTTPSSPQKAGTDTQPEAASEVVLGPGAKGDLNDPAARTRVDERTGKVVGEDEGKKAE